VLCHQDRPDRQLPCIALLHPRPIIRSASLRRRARKSLRGYHARTL
jgi:hypothetical protein